VIGIFEIIPSANAGLGEPIVVVKSGRDAATIGAFGVIEPVPFEVFVSFGTGEIVPEITGVVPAEPAVGTTGICKEVVPVVATNPVVFGLVQLTF
jgi:hypothetical protein